MSEIYVHVIPSEPGVVPEEQMRDAAVAYFRSFAPQVIEVSISVSDRLGFVDCGGNFGKISCPSCGAKLELGLWQDWMSRDFGEKGFALTRYSMPCCHAKHTLHELAYEWPQGFARCDLSARTQNMGNLSDEQRARFEAILGCPVRVVYELR